MYLMMLDFISEPWKPPLSGYLLAELLCLEMTRDIFGEGITRSLCLSSTHGAASHPTALMFCPKYHGQTPGDLLTPNRYYASKLYKFQATLSIKPMDPSLPFQKAPLWRPYLTWTVGNPNCILKT